MMWVAGVYAFFTFLYCLFLGRIRKAWTDLRAVSLEQGASDFPHVTVIVPVRNEAASVTDLLKGLQAQNYPRDRWELIVADDGSTDRTADAVVECLEDSRIRWEVLSIDQSEGGSKKKAVMRAIGKARGEWILTTDGDCRVGEAWIRSMTACMKEEVVLVAGPVRMIGAPSFIGKLQTCEWIGLQCIGAAGIFRRRYFYCNGANLAYRRQAFLESGGYSGDRERLSGDDTDVLLRFRRRWPYGIRFQADQAAIVETDAEEGVRSAFLQRHRWASKIPVALTAYTLGISVVAWLAHAGFLLMIGLCLHTPLLLSALIPVFLLKVVSEYVLLKDGGVYFDQRISFPLILSAQPLYALYITLVGVAAVFIPYTWKGRSGR